MELVSVVIPFYSNIDWLDEAIKSVIAQTYSPIEIIVVVDGTKECTKKIKENNSSVIFIDKSNGGSASARNRGIDEANGDYIAFLDSDDLWPEDKIARQLSFMKYNNVDISYHDYYYFDYKSKKNIKRIKLSSYPQDIWLRCFISNKIQISTVMISSSVKECGVRLQEDFKNGQDIEYFKDLALHYDFFHCDEVCSRFRVKKENIGFDAAKQLKYKSNVYKKIRNNNIELPKIISFSYLIAHLFFLLDSFLNRRKIAVISRILYIPHYLLLLIYRPILVKIENASRK